MIKTPINFANNLMKAAKLAVLLLACALMLPHQASAAVISRPANNLGLVGYWSFDEGTGTTATDFSGNGNTGTLTNMAAPATATSGWGTGKLYGGLKFDGTNDYVNLNSYSLTSGSVTISAWVKRPWNTAKYAPVFADGYGASSGIALLSSTGSAVQDWQSKDIACVGNGYTTARAPRVVAAPGALTDNTWHHIVCVLSASTATIYLDGTALSPRVSTVGAVPSTSATAAVGGFTSTSDYSDATLDEVRVYNRALSATEISSLYRQGASKIKTGVSNNGLVGYWSFNDGTSTKATDFSGNGNTGTLTNMAAPATATSGWGDGKFGGGVNFDGTNDYVSVPAASQLDLGGSSATVSLWFKVNSGFSIEKVLLEHSIWSANDTYQLTAVNLTTLRFNAKAWGASLGAPIDCSIGSRYQDGKWHQLVGVLDDSNDVKSIYYDGTLCNSAAETHSIGSGVSATYIGSRGGSSLFFPGSIDDVRIYNRVLSAGEVSSLYNSGAQKINASRNVTNSSLDSGLVGLWSFDGKDMNGTTAYDRSGSGNNGTLTNGATVGIGKLGQGLSLDGVNDDVVMPSNTTYDFGTGDFAFSWWEYRNSINTGEDAIDRDIVSSKPGFLLGHPVGGRTYVYMSSNNSTYDIASAQNLGGVVALHTWNHYVVTRNGTTFTAYKDGVQASTWTSSLGIYPGAGPMVFGGKSPSAFDGSLDDIRIYNRALSVAEVKALYNLGK